MRHMTTGAGNDIERATELARKMVCEWGMSEKLGPLTFGKKEEHIFLGKEIAQHRDFSEETALEIDSEIKKTVMDNYNRAKRIIEANIPALERLAGALLEKETLDGVEIDKIISGAVLVPSAVLPSVSDPEQTQTPVTKSSGAERVDAPIGELGIVAK
jgi:cell division protease FtsH